MIKITSFASSSEGNLYLLVSGKTKILLEAGVEKKKIRDYLLKENLMISELDGCIISHNHGDHSLSVEYVSDYIDTYVTMELFEKFENLHKICPKKPFKIGNVKILPIPIEHGEKENNAFVFMDKDSCVFFATDFSLMSQNVSNFKFDRIYIECNYDDIHIEHILEDSAYKDERRMKYIRQVSTHMSKENCKKHLRKMNLSNCKEIVLLHPSAFLISKENTKKEFEKEFKIKTTFAEVK